MAMYIYGLHPESRKFVVYGPFDTEGSRQRYSGTLMQEGTVTLQMRDRVRAESYLKQLADAGKLRGFESTHQPEQRYTDKEPTQEGGFFPKVKKAVRSLLGGDKEPDEWAQ